MKIYKQFWKTDKRSTAFFYNTSFNTGDTFTEHKNLFNFLGIFLKRGVSTESIRDVLKEFKEPGVAFIRFFFSTREESKSQIEELKNAFQEKGLLKDNIEIGNTKTEMNLIEKGWLFNLLLSLKYSDLNHSIVEYIYKIIQDEFLSSMYNKNLYNDKEIPLGIKFGRYIIFNVYGLNISDVSIFKKYLGYASFHHLIDFDKKEEMLNDLFEILLDKSDISLKQDLENTLNNFKEYALSEDIEILNLKNHHQIS